MTSEDVFLDLLRQFVCEVVFTKTDGTDRHMICTLKQEHIGDLFDGDIENVRRSNGVIRVFDLELKQWRSFRADSVKIFSPSGTAV